MRHDHDAGGPPDLLDRKARLREEVWDALVEAGAQRFPGAHGRIPNFTGAEEAAERLRATDVWKAARTIKANPDSPQWSVRQRALEDGKRVLMAAPRLASDRPFLLLDPARLGVSPRKASSIKGAARHARPVRIDAIRSVDLIVAGCVAVDRRGARLGKGGGFSDLEWALLREAGLVDDDTPVVTTVHPVQLVDPDRIPRARHDVLLDLAVTPDGAVRLDRADGRPAGVDWSILTDEKIAAIPALRALRDDC